MKNAAIFVAIGLAILGGAFFWWSTSQPYSDGITTTGTIVDEIRNSRPGKSDTFRAEIEFTTETGRTVTFRDNTSTGSRVEVGKEVRVSYRPDNPTVARNLDAGGKWAGYLMGAMGALFAFVGVREAVNIRAGKPPSIHSSRSGSLRGSIGSRRGREELTEEQQLMMSRAEESLDDVRSRVGSRWNL